MNDATAAERMRRYRERMKAQRETVEVEPAPKAQPAAVAEPEPAVVVPVQRRVEPEPVAEPVPRGPHACDDCACARFIPNKASPLWTICQCGHHSQRHPWPETVA